MASLSKTIPVKLMSGIAFFNGRLIKGSKIAIQKHIEAYLVARQRAMQQQAQLKKIVKV